VQKKTTTRSGIKKVQHSLRPFMYFPPRRQSDVARVLAEIGEKMKQDEDFRMRFQKEILEPGIELADAELKPYIEMKEKVLSGLRGGDPELFFHS